MILFLGTRRPRELYSFYNFVLNFFSLKPCVKLDRKNILRSCNSLSNLSGEDSCYLGVTQPSLDYEYLSEKLLSSTRQANLQSEDNDNEEKERANEMDKEREEEGEEEREVEEEETAPASSHYNGEGEENVELAGDNEEVEESR